jgi:hypothetical protein
LIEEKGYRGGSFPLLIQKEEEVENLANKKGVDCPTTNPEKTNNTKPGRLKTKLRMKVRRGNASEEAGLKIRDTDVKNRGYQ